MPCGHGRVDMYACWCCCIGSGRITERFLRVALRVETVASSFRASRPRRDVVYNSPSKPPSPCLAAVYLPGTGLIWMDWGLSTAPLWRRPSSSFRFDMPLVKTARVVSCDLRECHILVLSVSRFLEYLVQFNRNVNTKKKTILSMVGVYRWKRQLKKKTPLCVS